MFQKKQKPLHQRPPFVKAKSKSRKKAAIGIGLASVTAVVIAGVIEKGRDAQ